MKRMLVIAAGLVMITTTLAQADSMDLKGRFALGLSVGAGIPTEDYDDGVKAGTAANVSGEYYVTPSIALGIAGSGIVNDVKDQYQIPGYNLNASISSGSATVRLAMPGERAEPYVIGGIGSYKEKVEAVDQSSSAKISVTETHVGFHGGAGVNFLMSHSLQIATAIEYHHVTPSDPDPNTGERAKWGFVSITAGVRLLLGGKH